MTQSWNDLLFAHWRVDPPDLRRAVPEFFELDLFDVAAWLGVVPFYMTNVGARAAPALPWLSAFPELNVRTYVRVAERAGVYFFSLDAGRRLAVVAARALLNLPYYAAVMNVERRGAAVHYQSVRRGRGGAEFKGMYEPTSAPFAAAPGSIEYFVTERYCLYHYDRRRPPLPSRDSPPAVVTAARGRDNHDEYDGRCESSDGQRVAHAAPLRTASRCGRMGTDASSAIIGAHGASPSRATWRRAVSSYALP
jgi:uncharacterized protein YqjF (DUF2071 family)